MLLVYLVRCLPRKVVELLQNTTQCNTTSRRFLCSGHLQAHDAGAPRWIPSWAEANLPLQVFQVEAGMLNILMGPGETDRESRDKWWQMMIRWLDKKYRKTYNMNILVHNMKSIEKHALQTGPRYSQKDCVMVSRGTKIFHNYPSSRFANYWDVHGHAF